MKVKIVRNSIIYTSLSLTPFFIGCQEHSSDYSEQSLEQSPNVIIIITDDQGYGDISAHGNPILKTPYLDKLHKQSIRLTDFHVAPMCTPTRAQLLTGLDAVRTGAVNVSSGRSLLRRDMKTMADYFSESGYATAIFGKWHLGDNYPFRPEDRGFQETLWFPSSHIGSVPDYWDNKYFDDVYIHNGERKHYDGYCADVFFEQSMKWMQTQAGSGNPFFTLIPTNTPHQPYYAHAHDIAEMEAVVNNSPFSSMDEAMKYNFIRFLAMIRNIDDNMGKLMDFLEDNSLSENTILIFLTDNGSTYGEHYFNAGMRGRKVQLWEGGHRVPFFIRWPQGIGFEQPRDIDGLTQVQDVLPTLLDLCGINPGKEQFDGISLSPVFQQQHAVPDDRVLFINYSRMPFFNDYPSPYGNSIVRKNGSAVLWKRWRLLHENELYNLDADPLQENNVIDAHPDIAAFLSEKLDAWWDEVKDQVNIPERVIIGSDKENPSLITACEWLDVFVDQQGQVERGVRKNSYWLLEVDQNGVYEFELRRWPRESHIALTGKSETGRALPIAAARISITTANDQIINARKIIKPDDEYVVFTHALRKGPTTLHTWFDDAEGEPLVGAYYVYVTRK